MSVISYKMLQKANMADIVNRWMKDYDVIAPVKYGMTMEFRHIDDPKRIYLSDGNSIKTPKEFFFPQNDELFEIRDGEVQAPISAKPTILLGVKSCDVTSFPVIDKVFINEHYVDPYYKVRRDNTIVIGYACNKPDDGGFCTTLGISPAHNEQCDMFWHDIGDAYLIDVITQNGSDLANGLPDASQEDVEAAHNARESIEAMMPPEFDLADLPDEKTFFEAPLWDEAYQRCIGCGTCTYVCSTCHCFEFYDERTKGAVKRYRDWDSCMYALFTEHTSGHNPRPTQKERVRQRFMHKFCYYPINFGVVSCVGCGRCVRQCPTNVDIRRIIKQACDYGREVATSVE
ncbi:4Fe-4S dicluster domain-containing protein [Mahella australiensis]|uniref:4Fe-4S ferredoxin iron-sulfur binding domain protein n=1 Tax=Mahella australiensis (strain DSM 15567 / CIP 107919 / 50-1 BON) TaxID=697281 RepID=F4A1Y0_MAHA5|nr:4Fe-4S dicluster domain-containing protein [Mahella australiensis]AEE96096.1 4Fe-4S ferredoxin iron-sulfur binding domain protein [Mahella australiensis 50-1 BON]